MFSFSGGPAYIKCSLGAATLSASVTLCGFQTPSNVVFIIEDDGAVVDEGGDPVPGYLGSKTPSGCGIDIEAVAPADLGT